MSSETLIELKNVWKKYSTRDVFHRSLREEITNLFASSPRDKLDEGEFWALKDINLRIKKGECVGLFGPNGSGKTTILKLIASVTYPNRGEVNVVGRVAPLISVGAGFHPDLTGKENIYTNGTIIGMTINEIRRKIKNITEFAEIEEKFMNMPVKKYSTGMNARLGFSIAIHSSSEIILIDEILAVGDESFQEKCIDKIKELIGNNKTVIIVSHARKRMEELTDRILFIKGGEIIDTQTKL
ncbi:MAG: ABC transporter ATP-binding protein [Deltaproteobacteria bacterium]